jgi:paraquat-inducible protein A
LAENSPRTGNTSLWNSLGWERNVALIQILLAIGAFAPGLTLPVVYLRRGFSRDTYSVLTGIVDLAGGGNILLALIVFAFSVVFPIAKLATLLVILFLRLADERRAKVLRGLTLLGRWSMLDVFVIAILVGSVQLGLLSEGQPRPGLLVFGAAILLSMVSTMTVEALAIRTTVGPKTTIRARGKAASWVSVLACVLFLTGLSLPVMDVEKWHFWDNQYSVLGGIRSLAKGGEGLLAITLLLFVVALPLARLVGLVWIHWRVPSRRLAGAVVLVDKWAMLDVFGLALLIVIVKIGDIASVEPRAGFWVLLAAVSLSLYDSWRLHRGDPRNQPSEARMRG